MTTTDNVLEAYAPGSTNQKRAGWASASLSTYATLTGSNEADKEGLVTDLLGDLMHFCKVNGMNFDAMVSSAHGHFEHEFKHGE